MPEPSNHTSMMPEKLKMGWPVLFQKSFFVAQSYTELLHRVSQSFKNQYFNSVKLCAQTL
jgi:hypothetical protein